MEALQHHSMLTLPKHHKLRGKIFRHPLTYAHDDRANQNAGRARACHQFEDSLRRSMIHRSRPIEADHELSRTTQRSMDGSGFIAGRKAGRVTAKDNRLFVEACSIVIAPHSLRDLPSVSAIFASCTRRFSRWRKAAFGNGFQALAMDATMNTDDRATIVPRIT